MLSYFIIILQLFLAKTKSKKENCNSDISFWPNVF